MKKLVDRMGKPHIRNFDPIRDEWMADDNVMEDSTLADLEDVEREEITRLKLWGELKEQDERNHCLAKLFQDKGLPLLRYGSYLGWGRYSDRYEMYGNYVFKLDDEAELYMTTVMTRDQRFTSFIRMYRKIKLLYALMGKGHRLYAKRSYGRVSWEVGHLPWLAGDKTCNENFYYLEARDSKVRLKGEKLKALLLSVFKYQDLEECTPIVHDLGNCYEIAWPLKQYYFQSIFVTIPKHYSLEDVQKVIIARELMVELQEELGDMGFEIKFSDSCYYQEWHKPTLLGDFASAEVKAALKVA